MKEREFENENERERERERESIRLVCLRETGSVKVQITKYTL
jgi:hypothetical protein